MRQASQNRQPCYLRKETSLGGSRDRWLISYTDVVTILLILFLAIAIQGAQNHPARAPAPVTPPTGHANPALGRAQALLEKHGMELRMERRGLVITLRQGILFSSGDDSIQAEALQSIGQIAEVLRDMDNKVLLVGHADAVPIHNRAFRSNWELSAARSLQLLEVLTGQFGLAEERFTIASDGSQKPQETNDSEDGRARNRRVEIVILEDSADVGS